MRLLMITIAISLAFVSSCEQHATPSHRYFPLEKGKSWTYQTHYNVSKHFQIPDNTLLTIQNHGVMTIAKPNSDQEQTVYMRRTSHGTDYYLHVNDQGISRIAKRTLVELEPRFDQTERLVLPHDVSANAIGKTWSVISKPYVLHRILPTFEPPSQNHTQLDLTYELLSTTESVTVTAGHYENCLLVEGSSIITKYTDALRGFRDIEVIQREWYAPDVGLVKLERIEPLETDVFMGGSIVLELISH